MTVSYAFPPAPIPSVAIAGRAERFPVHRIFCVGRNYADHAKEMGFEVDREAMFFFLKPADAVVPDGATIPYPPGTKNFHHEIELVVALGVGGRDIPVNRALEHVFGYAIGNDLTRRDLQFAARDKGRPWDAGKAFDNSAPIGAIHPVSEVEHLEAGKIWLAVNGKIRQDSDLSLLIWKLPELIHIFSTLYELKPGDLIFTGTPAGVGPVVAGDLIEGGIDRLGTLTTRIAE